MTKYKTHLTAVGLLVFAFLYYLSATNAIELAGDATGYWQNARRIFHGLEMNGSSHKTVRFGLYIPTVLSIFLFGESPLVYHFAPLLFAAATVMLVFLSLMVSGATLAQAGITAIIYCVVFSNLRDATQLLPGVFSGTYCILWLYLSLKLINQQDSLKNHRVKNMVHHFMMGLALYLAYATNLPNLFYMFGAIAVMFSSSQFRKREWFLFVPSLGVALVFFIIETLWLNHSVGTKLGAIEAIFGSHMQSVQTFSISFGQYFMRITELPLYQGILVLICLVGVVFLKSDNRRSRIFVLAATLGYILVSVYTPKSIDPLRAAIRMLPRYFMPVVPGLIVLLVLSILSIPQVKGFLIRFERYFWLPAVAAMLIILTVQFRHTKIFHDLNYTSFRAQITEALDSGEVVLVGMQSASEGLRRIFNPMNNNGVPGHPVGCQIHLNENGPNGYQVVELRIEQKPFRTFVYALVSQESPILQKFQQESGCFRYVGTVSDLPEEFKSAGLRIQTSHLKVLKTENMLRDIKRAVITQETRYKNIEARSGELFGDPYRL